MAKRAQIPSSREFQFKRMAELEKKYFDPMVKLYEESSKLLKSYLQDEGNMNAYDPEENPGHAKFHQDNYQFHRGKYISVLQELMKYKYGTVKQIELEVEKDNEIKLKIEMPEKQ